jgi:hypothetical protein
MGQFPARYWLGLPLPVIGWHELSGLHGYKFDMHVLWVLLLPLLLRMRCHVQDPDVDERLWRTLSQAAQALVCVLCTAMLLLPLWPGAGPWCC